MSKDDRVIHEGQVLLTVKVRRVVKTAEYENYEVVLDEMHLARETDIKNTRERLIDAMTETIHLKVTAYEVRLAKEIEEAMALRRAEWEGTIEHQEGLPLDKEDEALRDEATEHAMHPNPEGGFKGLELDPTKTTPPKSPYRDALNDHFATPDELDGDLAPPEDEEQARRDDE